MRTAFGKFIVIVLAFKPTNFVGPRMSQQGQQGSSRLLILLHTHQYQRQQLDRSILIHNKASNGSSLRLTRLRIFPFFAFCVGSIHRIEQLGAVPSESIDSRWHIAF